MKINPLFYFLILFTTMFSTTVISSCHDVFVYDEQTTVEDSLGYEKLLGTYIFKPSREQAERLRIDSNEVITLRITKDSLVNFKSGRYEGKDYIDKMVLMMTPYPKEAHSSTWSYNYFRQTKSNSFELKQPIATYNNLSYTIEKLPDNDTLHICGYGSDPKYEVMRLVDFKKIK